MAECCNLYCSDLSYWGHVSVGVPQGSILDPLLFALYINDLPSVMKYSIMDLYADDAELHYSHTDVDVVESRIQTDLNAVILWLQSSHYFVFECNCIPYAC